MNLKWAELEFDEKCLAAMADQLSSHEKITPEEYEEMIWDIGHDCLDKFAATINTPLVAVTKKDKKAVALKEELLDHFNKWIKRRFAERYWDMYHQQAVYEMFEMVRNICKEMTTKVNAAVHAAIPTNTKHILDVTQNFHRLAKEELVEMKWYVPAIMPLLYKTVFLAARNIFRHFAAANLDCRPDSVSCGERYSTIAMESGRVVTIGNQDDLIETFKEEILGNLPSRFRKMFAQERIKKAKKLAQQQLRDAKMIQEVEEAEEAILREQQEEMESTIDENASILSTHLSPHNSVYSHYSQQSQTSQRSQKSRKSRHSNQSESESDREDMDENEENVAPSKFDNNSQNNTNNQIVFVPTDQSLFEEEEEEEEEEADENGPASPIRFSPVRQSPVRRMTGFASNSSDISSNNNSNNRFKMGHQIPSYEELQPDEYNKIAQISEPLLHARDVIDDPEEFDKLFDDMKQIFKNGHDHSIDDPDSMLQQTENVYTFAKSEWGDEAFMKEHAHQVELEHEKKRLQQHIERHAEDGPQKITMKKDELDSLDEFHSEFHDSQYDSSNITELGGLDVNDGERIMNDDSIYVFSKGRTTIKKFRLGSSDQHTNDGSVLAGEHRSFFSDTRPRLRTHDIFGRSLL
jgi:hypothetical protein